MAIKRLIFFGILLFVVGGMNAKIKTKIIAHRGFWNTEGAAQNSIAALTKADDKESNIKYFIEKGTFLIAASNLKPSLNLVKQE